MNLLETDVELIFQMLTASGAEVYYVGGCIRDKLIGRDPHDIDLCVSFTPEKVEAVLCRNGVKVFKTGVKNGTITAVINESKIEITTFRKDGEYEDSRHPQSVKFISSIDSDLARRDFTVNAMAYNKRTGLIDLFNGKKDIQSKVIRTVGEPQKRFKEDALRIMRALRFSSELTFEIEPITKEALFSNSNLLKYISGERIFSELKLLLAGDNVLNVLLQYGSVLTDVIPEIRECMGCEQHTPWHIYDVWQHTVYSVDNIENDEILRLTMLLHDIGKPFVKTTDSAGIDHFKTHAAKSADLAYKILKRLRADNKTVHTVCNLIKHHQDIEKVNKIDIAGMIVEYGAPFVNDLFKVRIADLRAHNLKKVSTELDAIIQKYNCFLDLLKKDVPCSIADLDINGNDLKELGFSGSEIGATLKQLLYDVIRGKVANKYERLKFYVSSQIL